MQLPRFLRCTRFRASHPNSGGGVSCDNAQINGQFSHHQVLGGRDMRKTLQLLSLVLVMTIIGLTTLTPSNRANADNDECFTRMSEETSRYIREMKIQLKGADPEFYSSKAEQVYLLSSEETLKLDARKTVKNTVAVINHKDARGKDSFYVIEQEITPGQVTFFLKKDSEVLQSLPVKLNLPRRATRPPKIGPGVPCKQSDCDEINKEEAATDAAMAARANQTCKRQSYCVQHCECFAGALGVSQTIKYVDPTSWRCRSIKTEIKYLPLHLWIKTIEGPLLDQAFDTAIKKEVSRYTF